MNHPNYGMYTRWAIDFLRAFNERPKIFQWVTKLCMGKYAKKELEGLQDAFSDDGWFDPFLEYDLKEYYKEGN